MNATPLPAGSLRATSLNAGRRAAELVGAAEEELDLLVVGGGVTGTGTALDAAARGLSVALVEAEDLAWGTSRWTSALVDGESCHPTPGEMRLARDSALERHILMTRTAPHLVRTLPQLFPLHERISRRRELLCSGRLRTGDALRRSARTPSSMLPPPRRVPAAEAMALTPGLRSDGLRGGLLGFGGQLTDDARLVVALARTAAGFGARVLTRVRARALDEHGAEVVDERSGRSFRLGARVVVNATGAWAGELAPEVRLSPTRGSHLVVDADAAGLAATALLFPAPDRPQRSLFLLPQPDGRAYLGRTDQTAEGPIPSVPEVPESDVDYLIDATRHVLGTPLRRPHVLGSFAGLRPLPARPGRSGGDLSRQHAVRTSAERIVTVIGGKLTTYRRIAADAVDAAIRCGRLSAGPSRTAEIPLVGAAERDRLTAIDAEPRLVTRYGTEAARIAALSEFDRDLADPVAPGLTAGEVLWAVRHECALTPDDVLDRRSRIGLDPRVRAEARGAVTELVNRALRGVEPD